MTRHMLLLLPFAFFMLFSGKPNRSKQNEIVAKTVDTGYTKPSKIDTSYWNKVLKETDTICTPLSKWLGNMKLVSFCYVRFGTNDTNNTFEKFLYDCNPKYYNREPGKDQNLKYIIRGDKLIVRIFYSGYRKHFLEPDSLIYNKGIVYLKERIGKKATNLWNMELHSTK
jgi:hypothetical protein